MLKVLANVGRQEKHMSIIKSVSEKKHIILANIIVYTERPKLSLKKETVGFKIFQKDHKIIRNRENQYFKHTNRSIESMKFQ